MGEASIALRDTPQVHPCRLFVDILSPKVSQRNARLPLSGIGKPGWEGLVDDDGYSLTGR